MLRSAPEGECLIERAKTSPRAKKKVNVFFLLPWIHLLSAIAAQRTSRVVSHFESITMSHAHSSRPPKVALMVETSNAYARGLLTGVKDYVRIHGPWNVHLSEHGRGDRPPKWISNWDGDGIVARVENKHIARALADLRVPIVDLSSYRYLSSAPVATTDNALIAKLAFDHFRERGFRHFAFCGDNRFAWSVARGGFFDERAREAGFDCEHYATPPGHDADSDPETDAIAEWLRKLPCPVAVFACYDARGQQVLDACQRAGLTVPEQVAVVGVDNDELLCELSPPPLSSVIPDTRRTGWEAAAMLDRLMRGEKVAADVLRIPPLGVCTRQSSDTYAVDDPRIARALQFIRENAYKGITVGDVLHKCPMARRVLEQRMRELLGRSPHEEITRLQIQRAKDLIAGTDLNLEEIADRSGFRSAQYLSVVFKREVTVPPSDYRRLHGQSK